METKERDYFFDNLKAVLIFLVVLGHFLLPIHGRSYLVVVKRLIYVFHMPLFVFVSGYFAKRIYRDGQYNYKKILYLIKAYVIFVVAIQAVYAVFGYRSFSEINFFTQSGAPWYLFAMIAWYLIIPLIRNSKPPVVLLCSVILALIAGFFKEIGNFLCLSRILVFGPFFYIGYYMEQPVLEKALRPSYRRLVVPAAASICAVVLLFGEKMKDEAKKYAEVYNQELLDIINQDEDKFVQIMSIEKDKENPRKDYEKYSDILEKVKFFYEPYYSEKMKQELPFNPNISKDVIKDVLLDFASSVDYSKTEQEWFADLKALGKRHGFAENNKIYKQNKDQYLGHVGDVAEMVRIALTSSKASPNIYYVLKILGIEEIRSRIALTISKI